MDSGKESGGARAVSPTMQTGETAHYSSRRDEKFETRDERAWGGWSTLYTAKDVDVLWWGFTFLLKIMMFRLDSF